MIPSLLKHPGLILLSTPNLRAPIVPRVSKVFRGLCQLELPVLPLLPRHLDLSGLPGLVVLLGLQGSENSQGLPDS